MTFAIAAAGTGGHVFPALAVARALEAHGVARDEIVVFGGARLAADAVPAAGYEFVGFELIRLERAATWRNLKIPLVVSRTSRAMLSVTNSPASTLPPGGANVRESSRWMSKTCPDLLMTMPLVPIFIGCLAVL